MYDVTIVGCGVVGASLAYTLSQYRLRVLVLERENDVAMGTTKARRSSRHWGSSVLSQNPLPESFSATPSTSVCRRLSVKTCRMP